MDKKSRGHIKKGLGNAGRRRRNENSVKIRKQKREQNFLAKRRHLTKLDNDISDNKEVNNLTNDNSKYNSSNFTVNDIQMMKNKLLNCNNNDNDTLILYTQGLRKLLSRAENPPAKEIIDADLLPILIQYLERNDLPILQFEAAWALTNIASTEYTNKVVEAGIVPHLVIQLRSASSDLREQCAWCIGNIAGESIEYRDLLMQSGAIDPLLENIAHPSNISLLRNCTWTLSNFCRGKPRPNLNFVRPIIPALNYLLQQDDEEILSDSCWAISYLTDGSDERIQTVVETGTIDLLINILKNVNKTSIINPIVRAFGNIVSGTEEHTQMVLDANILEYVPKLLSFEKRMVRKETNWMLSNIAAGSIKQIGQLLANKNSFKHIMNSLINDEWAVQKEAIWVICNIATTGTASNIREIVNYGAIPALSQILEKEDSQVIIMILEAFDNILKTGQKLNTEEYIDLIEECDGLTKIESLQQHENIKVYNKAVKLLEDYFGAEEENESNENFLPEQNGENFTFGINNNNMKNTNQNMNTKFSFGTGNFGINNNNNNNNNSFSYDTKPLSENNNIFNVGF